MNPTIERYSAEYGLPPEMVARLIEKGAIR